MEDIIYLFENITSIQRSIILVGGITFFWSIESIIPLFNFNYKKLKHAIPNFFFTLTTIIVNFSFANFRYDCGKYPFFAPLAKTYINIAEPEASI